VCDCVCIIHQKGHKKKKTVFKPNENSSRLENIFFFAHISLHFFVYIFLNTLPGKRGFLFSSTYIRLPLEVCSFTRTVWWILKQSFFIFFHARAICIFFSPFFPLGILIFCIENRKPYPQPNKPHRPLFTLSNFLPPLFLAISLSLSLFLLFLYFFLKN